MTAAAHEEGACTEGMICGAKTQIRTLAVPTKRGWHGPCLLPAHYGAVGYDVPMHLVAGSDDAATAAVAVMVADRKSVV